MRLQHVGGLGFVLARTLFGLALHEKHVVGVGVHVVTKLALALNMLAKHRNSAIGTISNKMVSTTVETFVASVLTKTTVFLHLLGRALCFGPGPFGLQGQLFSSLLGLLGLEDLFIRFFCHGQG